MEKEFKRIGERIQKNWRKNSKELEKELEKEFKRIGERIQKNWRKNPKELENEFKRIGI